MQIGLLLVGVFIEKLENMAMNWVMIISLMPSWCYMRIRARTSFSKRPGAIQLCGSSK